MSDQSQSNINHYEFVLSKFSYKTYIIGLATVFIFLLINLLVVGVWIKKKNLTLLLICKILLKQKQPKNINDEFTSILNPSKKLLKRQPSIGIRENLENFQFKNSCMNEQTHKNLSAQQQLKSLDPILFEEVNNIQKLSNKKIQLKYIEIIENLRVVRDWIDSMSLFESFFIIVFLLVASGNKILEKNKQQQQNSGNNDTSFLVGMIMIIISILLYFFINCFKILQKILNFFDTSNAKVSPLAEQSPSCNNLNKKQDLTKKQIKLKSSKFITCNGIQTQISIHQHQLQKSSQSESKEQNNKEMFLGKQITKQPPKKIQILSHLLDIVYLIPMGIAIIITTMNKFLID